MKIIKTILNIILSFLLIILIAIFLATNILENKILNREYIITKLEENEFYSQVSREIENGFENYIYQSGLPEDTIKDLFTDEMIKNDINSIVNKLYDNTDINLSSEKVSENLNKKIDDYLNLEGIKINNQGKENIKKFENLIINEYTKNINVSNTLYEKGHEGIEILNKIDSKIGNIPIFAIIVVLILLVIVNIKNLLGAINYFGISLLSLGILIKLGVNLIFNNIKLDNLVILTQSLSSILTNIIKDILYGLSDNANIFIVAGITAIIVTAILQNINIKNDKKIEEK